MEVSGQSIANWLVNRSRAPKSPNALEGDIKAIKSFRHAASKPISDVHIADSLLKGLLKQKPGPEDRKTAYFSMLNTT